MITNKELRKGISLLLAKHFQLFILNYKVFKRLGKLELNLLFSEASDKRVSVDKIKAEFGKFNLELRPTSEITRL